MLYRDAAPLRPDPALLASIGARLSAALASDEAGTGESAAKWLVPVSPDCAADIMDAWASVCKGAALPVTVVRALAGAAVAGAAAPDAAGKLGFGRLAHALYAVARLITVAPRAVPATDSNSPMAGLQADVARWASLVIEHVHLAQPHAPHRLDQALYALHVLEVAPDAGTAAAAVAKAAALASKVDAHHLRSFFIRLAKPLAAWHRSGLVSCEPAARALCARAPELLEEARGKNQKARQELLWSLRMLASIARVRVPELAEPWLSRASGSRLRRRGRCGAAVPAGTLWWISRPHGGLPGSSPPLPMQAPGGWRPMCGCAAPGGLLLARQGEVGWRAHAWQAALTVVSEASSGECRPSLLYIW